MPQTTFTSSNRWRRLKPLQHREWGNLFIRTGASVCKCGNTKQVHALLLLDSLVCLYVDNIGQVLSVFKTLAAHAWLCSMNKRTWIFLLILWSTADTYHTCTLMGNLTTPFREIVGTLTINNSESTFFTSDISSTVCPLSPDVSIWSKAYLGLYIIHPLNHNT